MTIDELNALTTLTAADEVPVWDSEESVNEPTKKITIDQLAAAIKTLQSLLGQSDVVNNLTSTATDKPLSAAQGKELNDNLANYKASAYKTTGLSESGCTFDRGGYATFGNLVIINFRIIISEAGCAVSGFPKPYNLIGFCAYDGTNEKVAYLYMDTNGTIHVPTAYGSSGSLNCSVAYVGKNL